MNDVFEKLRQHFNQGSLVRLRKTKEILKILEILFKPEEVEYALALPLNINGRLSLEQVAAKMNKSIPEVEDMLEAMAREAKVMVNESRKDGKKYYSLWTLTVGILENTFANGLDTDQKRKIAKLWKKYYEEVFVNDLASSKYPLLRIVPIHSNVDPASKVLPFEEIETLIQQAEVIAVMPCFCRQVMKRCEHIMDAEIVMGAYADYMIKYRGAKQLTKEEALQKIRECEEDGLVHLTGNAQEGSAVICNCCPCCCDALRAVLEFRKPDTVGRTNFIPRIDQEECTLCGKCQKICPMEAIVKLPGFEEDGSDSMMMVYEDQCIGCGLCSTHCPADAVRMVKTREEVPAVSLRESTERYLKEKLF